MLNQLINVFWTFFAFMPVVWYWYFNQDLPWLIFFVALSVASGFLPGKWYRRLQVSRDRRFYERAGIRFVRELVQDGGFSNRISGKKHFKVQERNKGVNYLKTIEMYERFHIECLLFFLLTSVHAFFNGLYVFSFIMLLANIIYNVCPILLQQYNRLRLGYFNQRK